MPKALHEKNSAKQQRKEPVTGRNNQGQQPWDSKRLRVSICQDCMSWCAKSVGPPPSHPTLGFWDPLSNLEHLNTIRSGDFLPITQDICWSKAQPKIPQGNLEPSKHLWVSSHTLLPFFKSTDELEPSGHFSSLPSGPVTLFLQHRGSSRRMSNPGRKIGKHVYTRYICSMVCKLCFIPESLCRHKAKPFFSGGKCHNSRDEEKDQPPSSALWNCVSK